MYLMILTVGGERVERVIICSCMDGVVYLMILTINVIPVPSAISSCISSIEHF